jgi:hypothetical protein
MRFLIPLILLALPAHAEPPVVVEATARPLTGGWNFDVTLRHPDTGWDHYADAWRIEAPNGSILGLRELLHPHVEEQPFTRSLSGVTLPSGTDHVLIRARCLVDGWSDQTLRLDLP